MKTGKKALLVALCAALLVSASALGSIAYLTDEEDVNNTFTVGQVDITLDETEFVDSSATGSRTEEGNAYHLLPGGTYTKDPTVTVEADSETSYVRMMVTVDGMDNLQAALPNRGDTAKYYGTDGVFLLQMLCDGWDADTWQFAGYDNGTYEFRYFETVAGGENGTTLDALFDSIIVPGELDNEHLAKLADVEIKVTAHAIQALGFADADAAWTAFGQQMNVTP